ncbi:MAG: hypothetical protein ACOYS2_01470 [Patescibacteria group bacterium]
MLKKNLIIFSLSLLFILSAFYLFWSAEKPASSSWWAVYFESAKSDKLDFVIENRSKENDFRYEVWQGEEKISENRIACADICRTEVVEAVGEEAMTVKIWKGEEKREIYKK